MRGLSLPEPKSANHGRRRRDAGCALLAGGYLSTVLRWLAVEPPVYSLTKHLDAMLDIVMQGALTQPPRDDGRRA